MEWLKNGKVVEVIDWISKIWKLILDNWVSVIAVLIALVFFAIMVVPFIKLLSKLIKKGKNQTDDEELIYEPEEADERKTNSNKKKGIAFGIKAVIVIGMVGIIGIIGANAIKIGGEGARELIIRLSLNKLKSVFANIIFIVLGIKIVFEIVRELAVSDESIVDKIANKLKNKDVDENRYVNRIIITFLIAFVIVLIIAVIIGMEFGNKVGFGLGIGFGIGLGILIIFAMEKMIELEDGIASRITLGEAGDENGFIKRKVGFGIAIVGGIACEITMEFTLMLVVLMVLALVILFNSST